MFVQTIPERRRYLPDLRSRNYTFTELRRPDGDEFRPFRAASQILLSRPRLKWSVPSEKWNAEPSCSSPKSTMNWF